MFGSSFCFTSDNRRSTRVAKTVINKDKVAVYDVHTTCVAGLHQPI